MKPVIYLIQQDEDDMQLLSNFKKNISVKFFFQAKLLFKIVFIKN